jgi:hypothetical protein
MIQKGRMRTRWGEEEEGGQQAEEGERKGFAEGHAVRWRRRVSRPSTQLENRTCEHD